MMFFIFNPGRALFGSLIWAAVGAIIIDGSVWHSGSHILWPLLAFGVALMAMGLWSVLTAIVWVLRGLWTFLTAPWR
jgi:hypothetical protein